MKIDCDAIMETVTVGFVVLLALICLIFLWPLVLGLWLVGRWAERYVRF